MISQDLRDNVFVKRRLIIKTEEGRRETFNAKRIYEVLILIVYFVDSHCEEGQVNNYNKLLVIRTSYFQLKLLII